MDSPNAKRPRTQCSITSTIGFSFEIGDKVTHMSLETLSTLLHAKLVKFSPSEKYWNGIVVLTTVTRTTLTKGVTKVVLYDVFKQKNLGSFGTSFIVKSFNLEKNSLPHTF